MPDERVSILGVLEGNLATELAKIGQVAGDLEKGVDGADKKVIAFGGRLKEMGAKLQEAFKPLGDKSKGGAGAADGVDALEVSQTKLVNKATLLTNRLLGLQFAVQSLASTRGGMGELQVVTDAVQSSMQGFAAGVSLLPGQLGVAFGGAGALILGVASALNQAKQQIDAIEQKSKDLITRSNATALKAAQTTAQARVSADLQDTQEEKNKASLDDQEQRLRKNAEIRAGNEQTIITNQKQERVLAQELAKLDADRASAQKALTALESANFGLNTYAVTAQRAKLQELDAQIKTVRDSKGKLEAQDAVLTKSTEDLTDEYNQNLLTYSLMQQKFADDTARKKYLEDLRKIDQALRDLADKQAREGVNGRDADSQRLELERQRLRLMQDNRRALTEDSNDRQKQNEIEYQQQQKVERLQQDIQTDAEERAYAEQKIAQYQAEQEAAARDALPTMEFMKGIAQGIGQQFAQATGNLIDGLVQGHIAFREFAGQFLLQIAKMIAQAIILKAIMAGLGVIGLNGGGSVTPGFENNHYAEGGPIPGPDVNADVVPAMLTPGEFVIRRDAAQHYGTRVMAALNRGMIPKSALEGVGGTSTFSVGGRFAQGGEVPYGAGAVPKPAMAFVVASNGELDRLLAGGDGAQLRFFERNRGKIRTALGIGGR